MTIWPPSSCSNDAKACVTLIVPPRAIGQPVACAAAPSTSAGPALAAKCRGTFECPASPAKSVLPASVLKNIFETVVAGKRACRPKRAIWIGAPGHRSSGDNASPIRADHAFTVGPTSLLQAVPSSPSRSAVASRLCSRPVASPPSSGCASGTSGSIHFNPCCCSGNDRKNGEAIASGKTAAPTSWWNPGNVSSCVRVLPPTSSAASKTVTCTPA